MNLINIPKNWDECHIDQYIAIKQLEQDTEMSFYSKQIEKLAILTDTMSNDDIWEDMSVEEISGLIKQLHWLRMEPSKNYKREILGMKCVEINKISLGEFLDLEYLFTDYHSNLTKICGVLYRKTKTNEWGTEIYQPYSDVNFDKAHLPFEDLLITDVYGVIPEYLNFKELITTTYQELFEPVIQEDDSENEEALNELFDEAERAEMEKQEQRNKKWGWELILRRLSNGDITKIEAILRMPLIFILNQLSMNKELPLQD
jgi:hypothetical protein